jgi:site-specific recombinase
MPCKKGLSGRGRGVTDKKQNLYLAVAKLLKTGTKEMKVCRLANFATLEKSCALIFCVVAGSAVCLATILNMQSTALLLLLINLIVAGFVAIFGSLRSRQEEEEKRVK